MLSLLAIAGPGVIIAQAAIFAIGVGLTVLSAMLLKSKNKSSPVQLDNEPTTIATRGAILPYLLGRRRIGCIFAWVGRRDAVSDGRIQSSGKSRGGRRTQGYSGSLIYWEEGIHLLCIGPVKKLHRIWQNGQILWTGPIDSITHPSGYGFQIPNGSGTPDLITIYWGEHNQPIDPIVRAAPPLGIGVASRFPLCCYVHWSKRLGPSPRWPLLEYEIETEVQTVNSTLIASTPALDISTVPVPDVAGINPAHALYQLLFAAWPYGLSQQSNLIAPVIDTNCLEELGTTLATEGIPISVFAPNGQTVLATISSIMQDIGAFFSWDPSIGKFRFRLIRPETAKVFDANIVTDPLPEIENVLFTRPTDKLLFAFADKLHAFKTATVGLDDDGQANYQSYQKHTQTEMRNIIHFTVAQKVAERRSQEALARASKWVVHANRGARLLFPGVTISIPTVSSDILRVAEVGLSPLSGKVQLTCVSDFYGASAATAAPVSGGNPGGGNQTYAVTPDISFAILEVPAHVLQGQPTTVCVPRIRAATAMSVSEIFLSGDNVTYQDEGQETDLQTGGLLTTGLLATDAFEIAQGPTFNTQGPDIGNALDLSGDEAAWRSGRQIALIDDEIFFVRKVTALGGTSYRLDGLIRARYDTDRAAHAIGATVYVFQLASIRSVQDPMLRPNALVYVKSDPSGLGGAVDPATITPVSRTLIGKGITPMPVGALRTVDPRSNYKTGQDISLLWNYRSAAIPHTGGGMQGAGSGVGTSPQVGTFELAFYTLGMVLKNTRTSAVPSFTYTNAMLIADFGSEQSFIVQVKNVNGGWKSLMRQLTVNLIV